jgi:hypothetical protein
MDAIIEVLELVPSTPYARKIRCKLCGETVFDLKDDSSEKNISLEMAGLAAHMSIRHQITVEHHKCNDPNCLD